MSGDVGPVTTENLVAAAAALRDLGASSALVVTEASNGAAVRTYLSAGFVAAPDVTDFRRPSA